MEAHCARWALDDIALSAVGATGGASHQQQNVLHECHDVRHSNQIPQCRVISPKYGGWLKIDSVTGLDVDDHRNRLTGTGTRVPWCTAVLLGVCST